MSLLLILVLSLAGVGGALYLIYRLLKRGQIEERGSLRINGVEVPLTLRYGSKLPKMLHAGGTTINTTICFRCYPRNYPIQVVGRPPISPELVAHELYHVVDRRSRGALRYWTRIWRDILKHPFKHDARPTEQEAIAAAPAILADTFPGVEARALLLRFR